MQISYYKHAQEQLYRDLQQIRKANADGPLYFKKVFARIDECLFELKDHFLAHPFEKIGQEVYFFKKIKPVILGELFYHLALYDWSIKSFHRKEKKSYWVSKLIHIQSVFTRFEWLNTYMVEKDTSMDRLFFVCKKGDELPSDAMSLTKENIFSFHNEPKFSTRCDIFLAVLIANRKLEIYVRRQLQKSEFDPKLN